MTYYTCAPRWEDMLTCIYDAWTSKKGHKNITLLLEPVEQYTLFDEYIHVDADPSKVEKLMQAICQKISPWFYQRLLYSSMAYEDHVLDNIYRCLILGFAYGPSVLKQVQYKDIMEHQLIFKRLSNEVNRFQEFLRFHKIVKGTECIYISHIRPKSRLITALGPIFLDRMPSEHWMIIDDTHRQAVIHQKDEGLYLQNLSDTEYKLLLETNEVRDEITDLWAIFFETIAIEQRKNEKCQRSHYPLWCRCE